MRSPRTRIQGWNTPLGLLRIGSLVLPLLFTLLWGVRSWEQAYDRAVAGARKNVELVQEYVLRVVQTQQILLDQVDEALAGVNLEGDGLRVAHERLARIDPKLDFTLGLGVVTSNGTLAASSRIFPVAVNVGDRDYFKTLRESAQPIHVNRVTRRTAGDDALVIAKRRAGEGFSGVVTAAVDVKAFTDFFGRIASDEHAAASLLRADGMLLVRHSPSEPPLRLPPNVPVMKAIATGDSGIYEAVAVSDGIARVYAFSRVGNMPLYVNFGVGKRSIFEAWLREMYLVGFFAALVALLGFTAATQAARRMRAEQAQRQAEFDRRLLDEAQRSAALRETLLHELHHRVKNNLQMVNALIRLRSGPPGSNPVLDEIERRVWAIAQVHDVLHDTAGISRLDLGTFLKSVCANPGIVPPESGVSASCDTEPVEIGIEQAVPVALVAVELIMNALKHAFPGGRPGKISVTLRRLDDSVVMVVKDDGVGLPEGGAQRHSGLQLVDVLVAQIRGELDVRGNGGTETRIIFPVLPEKDAHDAPTAPSP